MPVSSTTRFDSARVAVCDLNGLWRGKRVPGAQVGKALADQMRMPLSLVAEDVWGRDIEGHPLFLDSGDRDGRAEFTGRGPIPLPWLGEGGMDGAALVPVWMRADDGAPFMADPRRALAAVLERYAALQLTPVVATELEFYLLRRDDSAGRSGYAPITGTAEDVLSLADLDLIEPLMRDLDAACEAAGVPLDTALSEGGAGQFEINLAHRDDALTAADDAVILKTLLRGLATKHAMTASFMPKPFAEDAPDRSGSGFHLHMSLLDSEGGNVFDDGGEEGTELLGHAVAGCLAAMPESTLLFAPHRNSYRRLTPESHAPVAAAWGYDNRTTALRIPGGPSVARRLEHRVAGSDANPYLVLAGVLGAALAGIEAEMVPPTPVTGDAYGTDAPALPTTWATALDAFETAAHLPAILPPLLIDVFAAMKRQEIARFEARVTQLEIDTYMERI